MAPRYALFSRFIETSDGKLTVEVNYFAVDASEFAKKEGWTLIGAEPGLDADAIEELRQAEEHRFTNEPRGFWKRTQL